MTHFTIMVKFEYPDKILEKTKIEKIVEEMLEPYDENTEVPRYKKHFNEKDIKKMAEHYKIEPSNLEALAEKMKDWYGSEGGIDEKGLFYWSTYNKQSKWDWWEIGGRWSGMLKLKDGKEGIEGEAGIFDNETGIDCAFVKDLANLDIITHAVVDKEGWHEPSKMG